MAPPNTPDASIVATAETPVQALTLGTKGPRSADQTIAGILMITASTLFFACSDATSKYLVETMPSIEVAWLRYIIFCALVLPAAFASGGRDALATNRIGLQVLRGLGMVLSALFFVMGLRFLPVADATAINFISPIFITALSIPFLGEKVGLYRWGAAFTGLVGVLIIVRPGSGSFGIASLLPIASSLTWAFAAIATRLMSRTDRAGTTLAYSSITGFLLLTAFVPYVWKTPNLGELGLGLVVGLLSTVGHWLVVMGYKRAAASVLAPFSYTQLIWAMALGYLIFSNIPGIYTCIGGAVVALSGLYTVHRERVRAAMDARARLRPAT
jgi:drug/metabolite transporter (DMT)-like permease